jgi:hypothetical protein
MILISSGINCVKCNEIACCVKFLCHGIQLETSLVTYNANYTVLCGVLNHMNTQNAKNLIACFVSCERYGRRLQ